MEENEDLDNPIVLLIETIGAGYGSAFFVCKNLIATNIHVIAGAKKIFAVLVDAKTGKSVKKFFVEGVADFDGKNDLAILKIADEGIPLPIDDRGLLQSDEVVRLIGYPDRKYKVTEGTMYGIWNSDKWLQIKAETAKGNSGGPVLNNRGQVVGILARGGGSYGYAIPSNALRVLLAPKPVELLTHWNDREVSRAYTYYLRGEDKYHAKHYNQAITYFNKAIHLCSSYTVFYGYRGRAKSLLGESKASHGNIAEAQKHYGSAIDDYTKVLQIDPKFADAYNNRGWTKSLLGESKEKENDVLDAQHHYTDAIDDYTEAIKLNPKIASAYSNRGNTRYLLGKSKKSKEKEGGIEKAH